MLRNDRQGVRVPYRTHRKDAMATTCDIGCDRGCDRGCDKAEIHAQSRLGLLSWR